MMDHSFKNREQAGKILARKLHMYKQPIIVIGIPKGGIVVAAQVARHFGAPLRIITTRKLRHPYSPEYAIGAVTKGGSIAVDPAEARAVGASWLAREVALARREARRQHELYTSNIKPPSAKNKVAILVDDGIATGYTMRAALKEVRDLHPQRAVVAAPVAPPEIAARLELEADEVVIAQAPNVFAGSVGAYYSQFDQVSDDQVLRELQALQNQDRSGSIDVDALGVVLDAVKHYPITNTEIARKARKLHAPPSVAAFFEAIPGTLKFGGRGEVLRRSEEAEVLAEEEATEPHENLKSYDD